MLNDKEHSLLGLTLIQFVFEMCLCKYCIYMLDL